LQKVSILEKININDNFKLMLSFHKKHHYLPSSKNTIAEAEANGSGFFCFWEK